MSGTKSQVDDRTETIVELTAADVLSTIESELAKTDKTELSDEQMQALDIWGEPNGTRQPTLASSKTVDPISWKLFDISDVDGCSRGSFLALEIHSKQQGDRYTRPYATGIGQIDFESSGAPDLDTLRDKIAKTAERRDVEMLTDGQIEAICEEQQRADEEYAHLAFEGNVWAAACDNSTIWIEPSVSRSEGFGPLFNEIGLSDDQERIVIEASFNGETPRHIDSPTNFGFAVSVSFESDEVDQ